MSAAGRRALHAEPLQSPRACAIISTLLDLRLAANCRALIPEFRDRTSIELMKMRHRHNVEQAAKARRAGVWYFGERLP